MFKENIINDDSNGRQIRNFAVLVFCIQYMHVL